MIETFVAVQPSQNFEVDAAAAAPIDVPEGREVDELEVARELVRQARDAGVALTGPGGLLKAMTKTVIETALDEEMSEHPSPHDRGLTDTRFPGPRSSQHAGRGSSNMPTATGLTAGVCIIHLIRGTFRYAGRQHRDAIARALKPIYTAVNATAAAEALDAFDAEWGQRYPAAIRLWRDAWSEFIPFLDYDTEIRKVICSTNAIESLNARYRRAIRVRGHFPTEQAALKCLYLVTRSLDPTGTGQKRWTMRWKPALNAFAITFADRMPHSETN